MVYLLLIHYQKFASKYSRRLGPDQYLLYSVLGDFLLGTVSSSISQNWVLETVLIKIVCLPK